MELNKGGVQGLAGLIPGNTGSLAGTGASIGSMFGPIGTGIGAGVGALAGGVMDIMARQEKKRQEAVESQQAGMAINQAAYQEQIKPQLLLGGDLSLTRFNGNSHANGGIELPTAEVEGGETKVGDYVFSDLLTPMGQNTTYAALSKQIDNKYKRANDPFEKEAKIGEYTNLMARQEAARKSIYESGNVSSDLIGGNTFNQDEIMGGKKKMRFGGKVSENDLLDLYFSTNKPKMVIGGEVDPLEDAAYLRNNPYNAMGDIVPPWEGQAVNLEPISENAYAWLSPELLPMGQAQVSAVNPIPAELGSSFINYRDPYVPNKLSPMGIGTTVPEATLMNQVEVPRGEMRNSGGLFGQMYEGIRNAMNPNVEAGNDDDKEGVTDYGRYSGPNALLAASPNLLGAGLNYGLANQVNYQRVSPSTIDAQLLDPTRALQNVGSAYSGVYDTIRNNTSGGTELTNMIAAGASQAGQAANVATDYEARNTGILNAVDAQNAGMRTQASAQNAAIQQQELSDRLGLMAQGGQGLLSAGYAAFNQLSTNDKTRLALRLAETANYKPIVGKDDQIGILSTSNILDDLLQDLAVGTGTRPDRKINKKIGQ